MTNNSEQSISSQSQQLPTPELTDLDNFADNIKKNNQLVSKNLSLVATSTNSFSPIVLNDLDQLEAVVTTFVKQEITKTGLFVKISTTNQRIISLLDEIKFFGNSSAYLTGFFSSQFSKQDKEKWTEIVNLLDQVYNVNRGIIREIQDHFLFKISRAELSTMLNKELSFEDELFIRSILVKGYLANLRQLISPFYEVSDDFLVRFKKERINELRGAAVLDSNSQQEISLLEKQITSLQQQGEVFRLQERKINESFSINAEKITTCGAELNTGSVALGSIETARYFTSFVGHKGGWDFLKRVGDFGLKSSSFIAKWIPVVSVVAEAGTQMNNNRIIYNYEKRLRFLTVVEDVKRNLLIHEQRVTDHYIDNVLHRLQTIMLSKQQMVRQVISQTRSQTLLEIDNDKLIDRQVETIRNSYYQNIDFVRSQVVTNYNNLTAEKNQQLTAKLVENNNLQEQLSTFKLAEIEQKNHFQKELFRKQNEIKKLKNQIDSLEEKLQANRQLLEKQAHSEQLNQQLLNEAVSGKMTTDLRVCYDWEVQKRQEFEKTISVLLKKQNELEHEIIDLKVDLNSEKERAEADKDLFEYTRDKLNTEVTNLRIEKQSLEFDNHQLNSQIGQVKCEYPILLAAKNELQRSIKLEIEKCEGYRVEISEFKDEVLKLTEKNWRLEETSTRERLLKVITSQQIEKINDLTKQLAEQIKASSEAKSELKRWQKKAFYEKVKLGLVLTIDSSRSFLPRQAETIITGLETWLLASEINSLSSKVSWSLMPFLCLFVGACGFLKLISWMQGICKRIRKSLTGKPPIVTEQATTEENSSKEKKTTQLKSKKKIRN